MTKLAVRTPVKLPIPVTVTVAVPAFMLFEYEALYSAPAVSWRLPYVMVTAGVISAPVYACDGIGDKYALLMSLGLIVNEVVVVPVKLPVPVKVTVAVPALMLSVYATV